MQLTQEQKNALKAAIARADGWKQYRRDNGIASISNLTKRELLHVASVLGVDVDNAILAARDAIQGVQPSTDAPAAETCQDAPAAAETADTTEKPETPERAAVAHVLEPLGRQDFETFKNRLDNLAADALKPAVEIEKVVEKIVRVDADSGDTLSTPISTVGNNVFECSPQSTGTVGSVFGVRGKLGGLNVSIWDAPDCPPIEPDFEYMPEVIGLMAAAIQDGEYVWLSGPAGTGKTTLPMQYAARTKRPFVRIPFDGATEPVDLVGMTVPAKGGGTVFKPGVLTQAIQQPGTIILLDEPTFSRPRVLALLQTVLDYRFLTLKEHGGQRVDVAPGVVFVVADNTTGTGDETGHYAETGIMNRAFLDRFAVTIEVPFLPEEKEIRALAARSGCHEKLAREIVRFARLTRAGEESGSLTMGLGLRREVAFARLMTRGIEPAMAFRAAVVSTLVPDDKEPMWQLFQAEMSTERLTAYAKGDEPETAPEATRPENMDAQNDFGRVDPETLA